jgi:hypothetical protein
MPAPNLGLVGAKGNAALYDELQQIVAERQFAQQLEDERAQAEFTRQMKVREAELNAKKFGLDEKKYGLDERRLNVDVEDRERTRPGEIALRNAQTYRIQLGEPFENATQREHEIELEKLRQQGRLAEVGAKAAGEAPTGPSATALATVKSALNELSTGKGKSGAVGAKNWTSLFGYLNDPIAGTPERDYAEAAKTVQSFLTLTNMDQLAKLYPMSEADRLFLQTASVRLDRALQEGTWDTELARVNEVMGRVFDKAGLGGGAAAAAGGGGAAGGAGRGSWSGRPGAPATPPAAATATPTAPVPPAGNQLPLQTAPSAAPTRGGWSGRPRSSAAPALPMSNDLAVPFGRGTGLSAAPGGAPPDLAPPGGDEALSLAPARRQAITDLLGPGRQRTDPAGPSTLLNTERGFFPRGSGPAAAPATPPDQEFDSKVNTVRQRVKAATGLELRVISGRRTADQQGKLFAQGRTAPGAIITDADGRDVESKHQSGEGADLWFVDKSGKPYAPKASDPLWDVLGRIAKEEGLVWGGDWKGEPGKSVGRDPAHVQLGRTLKRNKR